MHSIIARADLLLALSVAPQKRHRELSRMLGYHFADDGELNLGVSTEQASALFEGELQQPNADLNSDTEDLYLARRAVYHWTINSCHETHQQPMRFDHLAEVDAPNDPLPTCARSHPLRLAGQWQNLWDMMLTGHRKGQKIHLDQALKRLQRAQPLDPLPKQWRRSFNRSVVLLFERNDGLKPVYDDQGDVCKSLKKLLGAATITSYCCQAAPQGEWRYFNLADGRGVVKEKCLPKGAQIILVGTFGALKNGNLAPEWAQFVTQLHRQKHPVALLSACPIIDSNCPVFLLDPVKRLTHNSASAKAALDTLISGIAQCYKVTSIQLRNLQRALPNANVTTELQVWQHLEIEQGNTFFGVSETHRAKYLAIRSQQRGENKDFDQALIECNLHNPLVVQAMGDYFCNLATGKHLTLDQYPVLQALASNVAQKRKAGCMDDHQQIIMRSLLPAICSLAQSQPHTSWMGFLNEAQQIAFSHNLPTPLQAQGLDQLPNKPYWLYQLGNKVILDDIPPVGFDQSALALGQLSGPIYGQQMGRLAYGDLPSQTDEINLENSAYRYQLLRQTRPPWAQRMWRDTNGLHAAHAGGLIMRLAEANPNQPQARWQVLEQPWAWAQRVGVDEYGLWAEFAIDKVVQRLRWIAQGTFKMGSPITEENRRDDENQHDVTLTQGFWLSETSCTQALWQAVMGSNPSSHQGEFLPVEQVTWNDCERFTEKLSSLLPGLALGLPTEAQWEYACRAGKNMAYWWGEQFDDTYANNKNGTKQESHYPSNGFGLKSMSGNVCEWCEDYYGAYAPSQPVDPAGPRKSGSRVLRGGGWNSDARHLRSAYRCHSPPDSRFHFIGLRLAGGFNPQLGGAEAVQEALGADRRAQSDRKGSLSNPDVTSAPDHK